MPQIYNKLKEIIDMYGREVRNLRLWSILPNVSSKLKFIKADTLNKEYSQYR